MSKKNNFKKGDSVLYSKKRYTIVNYSKNIEIDDGTGNITSLNSEEDLIKMMTDSEIEFARESIEEILILADKTKTMKKDDTKGGGYYGTSLTILIACAFDAMGRIGLDKNNKESDKNKTRFQFIQDEYVNKGNYGFTNDEFVDIFYTIYRCGLVHSGTIDPNNVISSDNNVTNVITHDAKGVTKIYLDALIKMATCIFKKICTDYNISNNGSIFSNPSETGDTQTIITQTH